MDHPLSKYRSDIQGLRAVAVLAVVLFHAGFSQFDGGFVGVDVFFVISGFLITRMLRDQNRDGSFSFVSFYTRRARRLFPALFATVAITFAASAILLSPDLFAGFSRSAIAALLSVSNVYFWLDSGYFDAANILKPLLHTWSLAVEEQFYLVWPVVMFVAMRRSERTAFITLAALALLSLAAGLVFNQHPTAVFYLMPFRVFELAAGGLAVWAIDRLAISPALRDTLSALGLAMIGYSVFAFSGETPFPWNGLVPSVGAALVIFSGGRLMSVVLGNPVAVWLGTISYSTYLVHWPLVVLYRYAVDREMDLAEKSAMVAGAIGLGAVMFYVIEERFRHQRPGSLGPRSYWAACVGALLLIAVPAAHAAQQGWVWRLGDRAAAYEDGVSGDSSLYGGTACEPPRCANGVTSGVPLYVIGDSHARALYAGVVEQFPDRPIIVFEASGCPFFSLAYWPKHHLNTEYRYFCQVARQIAFDELKAVGEFDLIIGQSWEPYDMLSDTGNEIALSSVDDFAKFAGQELALLNATLHPRNLLVVGNVPTTGAFARSVMSCFGRPLADTSDCANVPVSSSMIDARKRINVALRDALPGKFLDPYSILCDADNCHSMADGRSIYSDWDHLSIWGSKYVARRLFPRNGS